MLSDKTKRTINQAIRDVVSSISALYVKTVNEQKRERQSAKSQTTQTTPRARIETNTENKGAGEKVHNIQKWVEVKRKKTVRGAKVPSTDQGGKEMRTDRVRGNQENRPTHAQMAEKDKGGRRRLRVRPDTIVIGKTGNMTYADMLKTVRDKPELKELGERVDKIRRNTRGELYLRLKNVKGLETEKYRKEVEVALENVATVKALCQEMTIECRDLDESTTTDDIGEAITRDFPEMENIKPSNIKLRTMPVSKTQIARFSLPIKAAIKMLETGYIRVGWVRCRLRECITPLRCYKCLEYGHIARRCTGKVDRSKLCLRCGKEGHMAKACQEAPKCMLCDSGEMSHATGSFRCPSYKKALQMESTKPRHG